MNYFAYGSNMSVKRLLQRVPAARRIAVHTLHHHRLQFHKVGRNGSGKCDAFFTGHGQDVIYGVLYHIDDAGKAVLDRVEGLGAGYDEKWVEVVSLRGERVAALTYVATHIDQRLQPFTWYKQHVLVGAVEAELPRDYIATIEQVAALPDSDAVRHSAQVALYAGISI